MFDQLYDLWNTSLSKSSKIAVSVVGIIILLCIFSIWTDAQKKFPKQVVTQLEKSKRQALQLYQMSVQDSNPLIALIHVNYALAYLHTVRAYGTPEEINKLLSVNVQEMIEVLEDVQQKAILTISQKCPSVKTDSGLIITSGWI
jgi:hypothetical protein